MPFGLKNAPRVFQKAIQEILGDLHFCKIFLDDILVYSKSETVHYQHLFRTLKRLWDKGISINWDKTNLFQKSVTYLGHILTEDKILPSIEKVVKFKLETPPKTKKQLQKILGFIN